MAWIGNAIQLVGNWCTLQPAPLPIAVHAPITNDAVRPENSVVTFYTRGTWGVEVLVGSSMEKTGVQISRFVSRSNLG